MRSFLPTTRRRPRLRALLVGTAALAMTVFAVPAHADGPVVPGPGWNMARITQAGPVAAGQTSFSYTPHSHGAGVNAYVIDSGLDYGNSDLGGRAALGYDTFGGDGQPCPTANATDGADPRHGTEVADVLGGTQYGVANQVRLWSVKVADCGNVPHANFLAGINWVAAHHISPAIAVISRNDMGAGYIGQDNDLAQAVNALADSGVFVAVSAGNVGANDNPISCFIICLGNGPERYAVDNPPANAGHALVVMAMDRTDQAPDNSTYTQADGCTSTWSTAFGGEIYAPGVAIPTVFGTACGTSEAAPMAAGVAALYKATYGDVSSAALKTWIFDHATANAITNNPPEQGGNNLTYTPNLLLNTGGL
ncbi:hypothetical protein ABH931_002919 [Streptacidiphilus sp. MAP12-33]|uniref:S8 family serine peptidase n=1 Tax=Streptacidiphilus sp. MAP12-33 TaxID=3156266 RepID=UPI0035199FE0